MNVKKKDTVIFNLPNGKQDTGTVKKFYNNGLHAEVLRKDGRKISIAVNQIVNVVI